MSLKGKFALVTGSSRGIGRGIALKLAEAGAQVAVNYVANQKAAEDTLKQIQQRGAGGFMVQADIGRPDAISQMFEKVKKEFGALDIFVSNARSEVPTFYSKPMDLSLEQWQTAMDTQARAFLIAARAAAGMMRDAGRIIAITYAPGSRTGSWQSWVAMGSAKAALESLVRYFAVTLAKRGITVNALSPGWIEDSVLNSLPPQVQQMIHDWGHKWIPMGRLGTPQDVGNAVTLLCSNEAAWITGQTIAVDGGAALMDASLPLEIQMG